MTTIPETPSLQELKLRVTTLVFSFRAGASNLAPSLRIAFYCSDKCVILHSPKGLLASMNAIVCISFAVKPTSLSLRISGDIVANFNILGQSGFFYFIKVL